MPRPKSRTSKKFCENIILLLQKTFRKRRYKDKNPKRNSKELVYTAFVLAGPQSGKSSHAVN